MFGAILGDIIGSPYEFDMGNKSKNFPFFDKGCEFTDDTVMTIAVAEALMDVDLKSVTSRWSAKMPRRLPLGAFLALWMRGLLSPTLLLPLLAL